MGKSFKTNDKKSSPSFERKKERSSLIMVSIKWFVWRFLKLIKELGEGAAEAKKKRKQR